MDSLTIFLNFRSVWELFSDINKGGGVTKYA